MARIQMSVFMGLWLGISLAWAQLPAWDFETGVQGWISLDKEAQLTVENAAEHVFQGAGSLRFSFAARPVAPNELPGIVAVPVAGLSGAACLHLAIKSSVAGPVVLGFRERDESNYMLFSYLSADTWHVLDLPLAQFRLDENSQDENGHLDPEQIMALAIADVGYFLAEAMAQGKLPFHYERPSQRVLWLDEVRLLSHIPQRLSAPPRAEAKMLEDCDADTAYFMCLGGRSLRLSSVAEPAVRGQALRLDYELPDKTLLALGLQLPAGVLQGFKGLSFAVRSSTPRQLLVLLEEEDRSRYVKLLEIAPGDFATFEVFWTEATLSEDTRDPDEGLQPESIRTIIFADATSLIQQKDTATTLWLDEIMAVP